MQTNVYTNNNDNCKPGTNDLVYYFWAYCYLRHIAIARALSRVPKVQLILVTRPTLDTSSHQELRGNWYKKYGVPAFPRGHGLLWLLLHVSRQHTIHHNTTQGHLSSR